MDCDEIREKLPDLLEGLLLQADNAIVTGHLASCARCRKEYDDLQKTVAHLKNLEEVEPPEWLAGTIMAKVKEAAKKQNKGRRRMAFRPSPLKVSFAAAASILIAVTAFYLFKASGPAIEVFRGRPGLPGSGYGAGQKNIGPAQSAPQSKLKKSERKEAPVMRLPEDRDMAGAPKSEDEQVVSTPARRDLGGAGNGLPSPRLQAEPGDRSTRSEEDRVPGEITPQPPAALGAAAAPKTVESAAPPAAQRQNFGQKDSMPETKKEWWRQKIIIIAASGAQTTDLLKKEIQSHLGEISGCYEKGRGRVSVTFSVTTEGNTKQPQVVADDTGESGGSKCLAEVMKKWRFPLIGPADKVSVTFEVLP